MVSYRFEKDWKQFYVAKKTDYADKDCADKDCALNINHLHTSDVREFELFEIFLTDWRIQTGRNMGNWLVRTDASRTMGYKSYNDRRWTTEGGVRRMNPSCKEEGLDRFLNFASAREG